MQTTILEMHAIVHGVVQGVCFRATTLHYGKELNLIGTVCNLPDGCVEIFAQGDQETLNRLLSKLKKDSGAARIDKIDTNFYSPKRTFSNFNIII